jgi:hypothetical protein
MRDGCLPNDNLDHSVGGRALRLDLSARRHWRRTSSPLSAPACSTAIRISFSFSLGRSVSLESTCEALVAVLTSTCAADVPIVVLVNPRNAFLVHVRVEFVELLHFAESAPAVIAVSRVA